MVVRVAVEVVGQTVTAAVLAPVVLVWGLGRWAAMERRLDQHHRQTTPVTVAPPAMGGWIRRASTWRSPGRWWRCRPATCEHCEDQADEHDTWGASREGWR